MAAVRRTVREIPRAVILQIDEAEIQKTVVAAYARVSTEKEEQEDRANLRLSFGIGIKSSPFVCFVR